MNEELIDKSESKYTYTKIKPTTRILAMGSNTQINLETIFSLVPFHYLGIIFVNRKMKYQLQFQEVPM